MDWSEGVERCKCDVRVSFLLVFCSGAECERTRDDDDDERNELAPLINTNNLSILTPHARAPRDLAIVVRFFYCVTLVRHSHTNFPAHTLGVRPCVWSTTRRANIYACSTA